MKSLRICMVPTWTAMGFLDPGPGNYIDTTVAEESTSQASLLTSEHKLFQCSVGVQEKKGTLELEGSSWSMWARASFVIRPETYKMPQVESLRCQDVMLICC